LGEILHTKNPNEMDSMTYYWRYILGIPVCFSVLRLILFLTVYRFDTPQFFITKYGIMNSENCIKYSLSKIYCKEDAEEIFNIYIEESILKRNEERPGFKALFSPMLKKQFLACII